MKRAMVIIFILMICCTSIAEGMTPAMLIGSRGFVVMDENRLNSMNNSESSAPIDGKKFNGVRMCMYAMGGENSSEVIMFTDNDVYYAAFDMMSMFSGGSADGTAMAQTYIDLCNAFDFDIYLFGKGDGPMNVYGEKETLLKAMEGFGASDEEIIEFLENPSGFCDSKEDFISKVKENIK